MSIPVRIGARTATRTSSLPNRCAATKTAEVSNGRRYYLPVSRGVGHKLVAGEDPGDLLEGGLGVRLTTPVIGD